MSNSDVRVRRVSGQQLDLLWEYLNSHREIAMAHNRSLQAKEYSKQKWTEIAGILNSQGKGTYKDWKGWCKYWVDYKAKLKKRVAAIRSSQSRTGGGPCAELPLTHVENKFLQILGDDYGQGLPGVQVEPFIEHAENADDVGESPSLLELLPDPEVIPFQEVSSGPALALFPCRTPSPPAEPVPTPTASAQTTPRRSPRRRPLHTGPPPISQPPTVAGTMNHSRRRHRRVQPMSQEAARRALVQSSQDKADAAVKSARALEMIGEGIVGIDIKLGNIERILSSINSVLSRAPE